MSTSERRPRASLLQGRAAVVLLVVTMVAVAVAAVGRYAAGSRTGAGGLLAVDLAGSAAAASREVCGAVAGRCPAAEVALYRADLDRALWLVLPVAAALAGVCVVGGALFRHPKARRWAWTAAGLAGVYAVLGGISMLLLSWGLDGLVTGRDQQVLWTVLSAVTTVDVVILVHLLTISVVTLLVVPARAVLPAADFSWVRANGDGDTRIAAGGDREPTVVGEANGVEEEGRARQRAGGPRKTTEESSHQTGAVGICVSGGGIRSATVTLGALQALRRRGVLAQARYLVSVSGGGYMAGAFQLATRPIDPASAPAHLAPGTEAMTSAREVFEPGSPEENHLRRHGAYIADTRREWLVALAVVFRGVVVSLALIAGIVVWAGLLLAAFYRAVPLADLSWSYPFEAGATVPPPFPGVPAAVGWAAGTSAALGLGGWMLQIVAGARSRAREALRWLCLGAYLVAAGVGVLGAVVPCVAWAGARLLWWVAGDAEDGVALATGGAAGTVTVAYLGAIVSIVWRSRTRIGAARRLLRPRGGAQRRSPVGVTQHLLVWLVLGTLAAMYAVLLGAVVHAAARPGFLGTPPAEWGGMRWLAALALAGFVLVALLVDQTWMSLQPFYRRRLAGAFAVRRVIRDGVESALPYSWTHETTTLSRYGRPAEDFPQVIFSAAANLSGDDRTPPGRRAVSFSMSHDWVGGPDVGYVRTGALEDNLHRGLGLDLTVQNAVAVSGAAFASAMGARSTAYQTLFALSNARLGTWLPNPAWLYEQRPDPERPGAVPDWRRPRLPRVRRLTYFLRELAGQYDERDRMLLVTDGGHYDNLGLVELLRHRCRTVYCIDAGGDAPPLGSGLAEAITLAREELGVVVTLDQPMALVPGGEAPLEPPEPLAALSSRLATRSVVTGTVYYPEPFSVPDEHGRPDPLSDVGRIVIAKTRLTADLPYELLAYAANNPVFPHDSTSDQWFDHGQFNAYRALGEHLGEKAADAIFHPPPAVPRPRATTTR